ncbi:Carboxypeptidase C (cathepsin A) [Methylobacterium sp. 174MFSha1.1]|uniref:S10 family peptidase n=1 Tax=Methylobacterium sp. 174MFSha1.1 TaxID=1502749 RepID=UPI0008E41B70|nr:peptidase S10 [Methylobacterium sp. 174MFSha1.1]SFU95947.1 Carboxypeptidase C (cathepsin A) [Methylobacterium sp. 174MFSha1.1]
MTRFTTRILALAAALLLGPAPLVAQTARQENRQETRQEPRQPEGRRLPPDATTQHSLTLSDGRVLSFTAVAGSLPLVDESGKLQAEIAFTAFTLPAREAGGRPVTFAVNGGPGAASAYLNLAAVGPWRLPLDGPSISPSMPPVAVPNDETWLDFTDLVFIDPVGTGYSRAAGDDGKRYYGVESDAAVLSAAIARWLRTNDRLASPKFFLGESYGGFRGPLIARKLQDDVGVGLSGLVLLSPVLDFGYLQPPRHNPLGAVTRLPSLAAAGLERRGQTPDPARMREAEAYATGPYLADLLRGPADAAATERMTERVAALTGLDPALVRRQAGRVAGSSYQREADRDSGRVSSAYDTGVTGWDPDPSAAQGRFADPILTAMQAPLTSAIVDLTARTLNWRVPNLRYELLSNAVNGSWNWGGGRSPPEVVSELRQALALDGAMRVLVAHGYTDLVTPYFASKLILDQIPPYGREPRLSLSVYPGGHMFYFRKASRAALRGDALRLYETALAARQGGNDGR